MLSTFFSGLLKHFFLSIQGKNDGTGLPERPGNLYFFLMILYFVIGMIRGLIVHGSPIFFSFIGGLFVWMMIFVFSRPNQYNVTSIFFCLSIGLAIIGIFVSFFIGPFAGPFFMGWEVVAFWSCFNKVLKRKSNGKK